MFTQRGLSYIQGASKGKNVDLYRIYQEDARVHHKSTAREKAIQSAPLPSAVAGKGKLCGLDDPRKARAQCMHHIITHTHMHTHTHTHTHTYTHLVDGSDSFPLFRTNWGRRARARNPHYPIQVDRLAAGALSLVPPSYSVLDVAPPGLS
jgi:hypothetical protein